MPRHRSREQIAPGWREAPAPETNAARGTPRPLAYNVRNATGLIARGLVLREVWAFYEAAATQRELNARVDAEAGRLDRAHCIAIVIWSTHALE